MNLTSEDARRLVETAHRLEGWSGTGDSEEVIRQMGELAAKDPAGVMSVVGEYLAVLLRGGIPFMWDGQRLKFAKDATRKAA